MLCLCVFVFVCVCVCLCSYVSACVYVCFPSNLQLFRHKNITSFFCIPHHWDSVGHQVFQYLVETFMGFLLPFSLIAGCYASVFRRLRTAMFKRRGRGSFLILAILAAFALFWLPYHIVNILQVREREGKREVVEDGEREKERER